MRRTNVLFKTGLLTAFIAFVSILNIFALRTSKSSAVSAVRGVTFNDCNEDGLKGIGENGFMNMSVILTGRDLFNDTVTLFTTTDAAGLYAFTGVDAGTYRVKFTFPGSSNFLSFASQNQGLDDGVDSDCDASGYTDAFFVDGITDISAVDAGVVDTVPPTIVFTHPMIAGLNDGDTLIVACDNLPPMDGTWARGINNLGGADLPVDFQDNLIRNGDCQEDGYLQFLTCTFTTQNHCGLQSQRVIYVATIDTTAPVVTAPNDTIIDLTLGQLVPSIPVIPYTDNCSSISLAYKETETTDPCGKILSRIWTATDACGNAASDTQRITVILNALCDGAPATDTVVIGPFTMTGLTQDTCLDTYLGSGRVLENFWNMGSANGVTASLKNDSCVTLTRTVGFSGRDTIGGWHCDGAGNNCRYLLLIVIVNPDNPSCSIIPSDTTTLATVACGSRGTYCITGLNDINSFTNTYSISDNGSAYAGTFSSCTFDTSYTYEYHTFPFIGKSGPYRLDYWKLNGVDRTIASFDSISQLVDSMNVYDPTGNWVLDTSTYSINGGLEGTTYGQMRVTKLSNEAVGTSDVVTNVGGAGIQMEFAQGAHTVVFTKTLTGCKDTLSMNVTVLCPPLAVDNAVSTIKNTTRNFSVLTNDNLMGLPLDSIRIIDSGNGVATLNGSNEIVYTPQSNFCAGTDTLSYAIYTIGGADTADVVVTVLCPPLAVDDAVVTVKDSTRNFAVLTNDNLYAVALDSIRIIDSGNGVAMVNGSNEIVFTPQSNFCGGTDTLTYVIYTASGTDTADVVVTVHCPPVAVDDAVSIIKDSTNNFAVLTNDNLMSLPLDSIRIIDSGNGVATVNGSNEIVFTPQSNFCAGTDTLIYVIYTAGGTDTADVVVTVLCPPVAVDDAVTTIKNTSNNFTVLTNDNLFAVALDSIRIIDSGNGVATINGSNEIVFTPQSNFCAGTDTLSYVIYTAGGTDTADVVVTVLCPPLALDNAVTTLKNSGTTIDILSNDTLFSVALDSVRIIDSGNGVATLNGSNEIVFTPQLNFCGGNDTLTYVIYTAGGSDTADVVVTVTCPPAPIAVDDAIATLRNMDATISVLINDDLSSVALDSIRIIDSGNGVAVFNGLNEIVFTPQSNFCGDNDTLTYVIYTAGGSDTADVVVTVTCPPVPIAVDDAIATLRNTDATIPVLMNDNLSSVPLDSIRIIDSGNGVATFNGSNEIVFTPQSNFCGGNDTLTYVIYTAGGTDTADVVVTITCPATPIAVNDAVSTVRNIDATIPVLMNDNLSSVPLDSIRIIDSGNGVAIFNGSNEIVFTPQSNFCGGTDTLTYIVYTAGGSDTADVVVTVICPTPVAVDDAVSILKNDIIGIDVLLNDILNGTLVGAVTVIETKIGASTVNGSNNIIYTPLAGYCGGVDTIMYRICNASSCDTGMVLVTVNCPPIPPVALDDIATTAKNAGITITALTNDTLNGALVGALNVISTKIGSSTVNGSNQIVYTPQSNFCGGTDTITYSICNVNGCDTADIVVTVNCPLAPIAVDDAVTTVRNIGATIPVLTNDNLNSVVLDSIRIIDFGNGTSSLNGSNEIVFTPQLNYCGGNDTLTYVIYTDGGTDTADVVITVTCPAPVAVDDAVSTLKNDVIGIDVLLNDVLNGALVGSVTIIETKIGASTVNGSNNIIYTPLAGYCGGVDTIMYRVCNAGGCDTGMVLVTVNCPPIPPVALDDIATTTKNTGITITALTNDTLNGTLVGALMVVSTAKGSSTVNGSNQIVYTPQSNFCGGTDTITYSICNVNGCDTAIVVVTVNCPAAPIAIADAASTERNTDATISVLTNDNLNSVPLDSIRILDSGNGTATINGSNQIFFTPQSNFCGGNDTLTYVIYTDGGSDTADVVVTVTCPIPPVAFDDAVSTIEGSGLIIRALNNDTQNGSLVGPLTVISTKLGISTVNGLNQIMYLPQTGFCGGNDTIIYSICNAGGCDTATIVVTVNCLPPMPPVANDDVATTSRNINATVDVISNDVLNGTLVGGVTIISIAKGSASVNGTNEIIYTPQVGYCGGTDTVRYRICNTNSCDTAILVVTINCPAIILPIAVNDAVSTLRGSGITIDALLNDTTNGILVSALTIINTPKGTASVNGSNGIVYMPQAGFCGGTDTIEYTICNISGCDTAMVIVTVNCPPVVLPVANNDISSTAKNTSVAINVSVNDTPNGTLTKTASIVQAPSKGSASVNMSNEIMYTPQSDFCGGTDTLTYEICNADGCDTAQVIITVYCPPVVVDDTVSTNKNTVLAFKPTVNDTINGSLGSVSIVTNPKNGNIAFVTTDSILYAPINGFCGKDTISYRVCNTLSLCDTGTVIVSVNCNGDTTGNSTLPTAINDIVSTNKNSPILISVLANDTVNGGLSNPIVIITNSTRGTGVVNGNQITFTPQMDSCGYTDSLSYTVCNANGCDTAWVFVTVNCTGGNNNNANQPIAVNDNVTTGRNTQIVIAPIKNDTLNGTLFNLNIVSGAKNGSLAFLAADTLIYSPQSGYCGADTITYRICNQSLLCDTAIIAINVTCDTVPVTGLLPVAINDVATTKKEQLVTISVLTNDTINGGLNRPLSIVANPKKGTASVSVNSIIYTPQAGFCGGIDTLTYEICNANGCDTALVEITVTCDTTITVPIAVNDNITTRTDVPVRFKPTLNDTLNGTFSSISVATLPKHGTISIVAPDSLVFTPSAGYCGKDTMEYTICRDDNKCTNAFVFFSIDCNTGLRPDAINDVVTVNKNVSTPIIALSNDAVNGILTGPVSIVASPNNGSVRIDASNNVVYTPSNGFCGTDTIQYGICNVDGCDVASIFITVSCDSIVNRPDARDDYSTTFKNKLVGVEVLTNDVVNGVLDSIVIIKNPTNGTAVVNASNIDYTPNGTFCGGNDTLRYAICTVSGCDTANIIIAVTCDTVANQRPDAFDDQQTTSQARPITVVVLFNDQLYGANLDTSYIITEPKNGTATLDAFSNVYYTPNANFCGASDTLTYGICTANGCDTAQVVINVTCDSLASLFPIAINDTASTTKATPVLVSILDNDTLNGADTVRVVSFTKHGTAVLTFLNKIVYQPDSAFCGKDTLTYEICNLAGCDTAEVIFTVNCDTINLPIANNDTASTKLNENVVITVLANDSLRGATKAEITKAANHGLVVIGSDNKALYVPGDNFWGRDTFFYRICNADGCDTAMVVINVTSGDSIHVYTGFSPNGDGMNDKWQMRGIENFPDNQLIIYNRWGVEIFTKEKYTNEEGWDGTWNGRYVPDGTYFYVLFLDATKQTRKTGYIQLHR